MVQNDSAQKARSSAEAPTTEWHVLSATDVSARLGVDIGSGLSAQEADRRLVEFGPNRLTPGRRESVWDIFFEEVREPMIVLLLVTGLLYSLWGEARDAVTIFVVIVTLVGVELFNERRAQGAIAALSRMAEPTTVVRREGREIEISREGVVPGDVVLLRAGRQVPADARLLAGFGLAVDEAALTGESVPVEKEAPPALPAGCPISERRNLIFAGTTVIRGRGDAVVVATGMATELGRMAGMSREAKAAPTPLQQTMRELTRWLVWVALALSTLVPVLGWLLSGQPVKQMFLTGLSLAFATIPEELPIVVTTVLALGAYRLSQRHAIIRRLKAVEALGAVTVIATDKTGTLTENRMRLARLWPEDAAGELLRIGVLCNDAARSEAPGSDPLDRALLRAAYDAGLKPDELRREQAPRHEFTFDNARQMMSVVRARGGELQVVAKGAPEAVLARCFSCHPHGGVLDAAHRQAILETAASMAAEGMHVIAFAEKTFPSAAPVLQDQAESELTFVGLAGLEDPPRPGVRDAITACRAAGIRPIMITGDHPSTARAVAHQIGLDEEGVLTGSQLNGISDESLAEALRRISIFGRITAEQKLRIVNALQRDRQRVAVTGDGINDAPALTAADIGVAMGETGSDVARASADIVLADDDFATIVHAVAEGRLLFANLTKAVRYYLACKVALIAATLLPVLLKLPVPFAPVQIILMELFMDLGASAAFVAEPGEPGLMRYPPRDVRARFMNRAMSRSIFSSAAGLFAAVSAVYLATWYDGAGLIAAQTVAFVTWLLGHVLLAFNLRAPQQPLFRLGFFSNRPMIVWAVAASIALLCVVLVPAVRSGLKTVSLSATQWELAIGAAVAGTFWLEAWKWIEASRGS